MQILKKCLIVWTIACLSAPVLIGCGQGNEKERASDSEDLKSETAVGDDKKVKLTMLGWEIYQQKGMEELAKAYHEKNPNVTIEVQISTWSEYWTKLEAMANSHTLPDIFWMHTNEFSKYADANKLADLTDLYDDVNKDYYKDNFSDSLC